MFLKVTNISFLMLNSALELYHKFIDENIIPLTKGELGYTSLTPLSNHDVLKFIWLINDQEYLFELDNGSDGIDLRRFYDKLIEIQKNSGTQRNLVLFHDINFGQEYGLAYIDKKTEKKLFSLFDIGVLDW